MFSERVYYFGPISYKSVALEQNMTDCLVLFTKFTNNSPLRKKPRSVYKQPVALFVFLAQRNIYIKDRRDDFSCVLNAVKTLLNSSNYPISSFGLFKKNKSNPFSGLLIGQNPFLTF